jgi:hypothetical protein
MNVKSLWSSVMENPRLMQKFNGWAAVVWFFLAFPICIFLSTSIPLLVFISVYAIVTGHWSAWQAARTEVKQEQEAAKRENE